MLYLLTFLLGTISAHASAPQEPFFHNEIIHSLDGAKLGTITYGIDGGSIHDMLWLLQQLNNMVLGHKDSQGTIIKKYRFKSEPCTLFELCKIEKSCGPKAVEEKRTALLKTYRGETASFKQAWQQYEQQRTEQLAEVQKTLKVIRDDFEETTKTFMMQMRILKPLICKLIEEWATRCNRQETFLLTWNRAQDHEFELFHKEITTCQSMLQFMADLKDFLTKLVHSCPRAWKEFEEHQHDYAHRAKHVPSTPTQT